MHWAASIKLQPDRNIYSASVTNTNTTLYSSKGKPPQKRRCENSSGTLVLLITLFLVTQFITRLEQRKWKAPRELHSCWVVFSVTREMQKWLPRCRWSRRGAENTFSSEYLCLPVFTKRVIIHALRLHVWVKVLFFLYCTQNERKPKNFTDISHFHIPVKSLVTTKPYVFCICDATDHQGSRGKKKVAGFGR